MGAYTSMARRVAAIWALLLATQACSLLPRNDGPSRIVTGPNGLRTFTFALQRDGIPVACPAFGLEDPVRGLLDGMMGAREPVWITTDDGRELSVVWPAGFTVRFEPKAFLYSDSGEVVAAAGQAIELGQTRWESAAGTYEDPYFAQGLVFGGCYPFSSDIRRPWLSGSDVTYAAGASYPHVVIARRRDPRSAILQIRSGRVLGPVLVD